MNDKHAIANKLRGLAGQQSNHHDANFLSDTASVLENHINPSRLEIASRVTSEAYKLCDDKFTAKQLVQWAYVIADELIRQNKERDT